MDKTTDQLLNLLEAEIDTTDSEPKYCIIDPDRREIYVDPDYQILGVESDEDVEECGLNVLRSLVTALICQSINCA